jgi:hypothetical protein
MPLHKQARFMIDFISAYIPILFLPPMVNTSSVGANWWTLATGQIQLAAYHQLDHQSSTSYSTAWTIGGYYTAYQYLRHDLFFTSILQEFGCWEPKQSPKKQRTHLLLSRPWIPPPVFDMSCFDFNRRYNKSIPNSRSKNLEHSSSRGFFFLIIFFL